MSAQLLQAFLIALSTAVIAFPVGYFWAQWAGWLVFCIGLGLQLLFHFRNFARLERWSRSPVVAKSGERRSRPTAGRGRGHAHSLTGSKPDR